MACSFFEYPLPFFRDIYVLCYANEESDPQNIKILANTESRISLEIL